MPLPDRLLVVYHCTRTPQCTRIYSPRPPPRPGTRPLSLTLPRYLIVLEVSSGVAANGLGDNMAHVVQKGEREAVPVRRMRRV
jgi:hypothetical protein